MAEPTYLERLAVQLTLALTQVPETTRARHAAYLTAAQNADGGFSGREGPSDLYYTGFALRSLGMLGAFTEPICHRAAGFLRASLRTQASVVDFFSLLYSCQLVRFFDGPDVLGEALPGWPDRTATALETFATPDGGYAKTAGGTAGSTYHTFLVALCYQLIDRPLPNPDRTRAFIDSRRREDGGYVEIGAMKRSGTNPTAAAVGVLQILHEMQAPGEPLPADVGVIDLLTGMVSFEGGLRANSRAPVADLLSTFTGLWTLQQLSALDRIDRRAALGYVQSLEQPGGGFRAGLWDDRADVEYTFYGLGSLALLSQT